MKRLTFAVLALSLTGAGQPTPPAPAVPAATPAPASAPGPDIVAQRGTVQLTGKDVRELLDRADPATRARLAANPAAAATAVRERLLQLILDAEAHAKGWDQRPEIVQQVNDARDTVIAQTYLASQSPADAAPLTESDVVAAYEANKGRFMVPKQYNLTQIFLPLATDAAKDADDQAHRQILDLRTQALRPKADFADLARKTSQDRGTIGWVREDQLVAGVKEAVVALPDGGVSQPVRSASGWHVFKLTGTRPPAPAPLSDVHDQLAQALRQARQQQAARTYVEDLLKREPIQVNEIALNGAIAPR